MKENDPKFSKSVWILKDLKKKTSMDVIKIISKIDEKPVLFDFSAGNILVIRYSIETYDGLMNLFIPAINSFVNKLKVGRFFELGSRRCYNFEIGNNMCDWIIYVNRIKNLTPINLTLGDRLHWNAQPKSKIIEFQFDETWLDRSLPIKNNLVTCTSFFDNLEDICPDTMLSSPIKILRISEGPQIEILEPTGSTIRNVEFMGLNHNHKLVRLYVPYFLRDLVKTISERLDQFNIVINRLKVFFKKSGETTFAGFLWDPTLSGFIFQPKEENQKELLTNDGEDIFGKLDGHSLIELIVKDFKITEDKVHKFRQESFNNNKREGKDKKGQNQNKGKSDTNNDYGYKN